jgi:hypothetical protein
LSREHDPQQNPKRSELRAGSFRGAKSFGYFLKKY